MKNQKKILLSFFAATVFIALIAFSKKSNIANTGLPLTDFWTVKGNNIYEAGKPIHAIGFNKWDLLQQILSDYFPEDFGEIWVSGEGKSAAENALRELNSLGFNVIRVFGSPYHNKQLTNAFFNEANRSTYFIAHDDMLKIAKKHNQKIIYTFGWHLKGFALRRGETFKQLIADKNSNSRKDFELYVTEVVSRYKDNTTIAMWEIANEGNLTADLGSNKEPGYTYQELAMFYSDIIDLIRDKVGDKNHPISSGDSNPRGCAFNLNANYQATKDWDNRKWIQDSFEQNKSMLKMLNQKTDVASIHFYGKHNFEPRTEKFSLTDLINMTSTLETEAIGKPLLIGEIGPKVLKNYGYKEPFSKQFIEDYCKLIVEHKVALTLFWSYQVDAKNPAHKGWDIRKDGGISKSDNEILTLLSNTQAKLKTIQ